MDLLCYAKEGYSQLGGLSNLWWNFLQGFRAWVMSEQSWILDQQREAMWCLVSGDRECWHLSRWPRVTPSADIKETLWCEAATERRVSERSASQKALQICCDMECKNLSCLLCMQASFPNIRIKHSRDERWLVDIQGKYGEIIAFQTLEASHINLNKKIVKKLWFFFHTIFGSRYYIEILSEEL